MFYAVTTQYTILHIINTASCLKMLKKIVIGFKVRLLGSRSQSSFTQCFSELATVIWCQGREADSDIINNLISESLTSLEKILVFQKQN